MEYVIHLVVPKAGRLTPAMLEWAFANNADASQPEAYHPFRKLKPRSLALLLLQLDQSLIPEAGEGDTVILHYPMRELSIRLFLHDRGVVLAFPLMNSMLARIVLGICYTYIRFLYDQAGFWSYDPQLNVISYADDYQSIDEAAELMDALLPRLLNPPTE
ncbi:MAG: hypothetical protein IPK19_14940 [Chloroflexi bacterium]|nr:hypothetical protein [Chloroflexota bacterium]